MRNFKTRKSQNGSAPIFAIIIFAVIILSSLSKCGSSDKPPTIPANTTTQETSSGTDKKFTASKSVKFSFGTVSKGMLYDDYLAIAPKSARQKLEQRPDSSIQGSIVFTETCVFDGKPYTLLIARSDAAGPYKVDSILANE